MDLLKNNTGNDLPIFRAFVEKVLKRRSEEILQDQQKIMAGFSSGFWANRSMQTSTASLIYSHLGVHRFADMKTRKVDGKKKDKTHYEIHNRILMGNFAGIMNELTYGLTENVKAQLRQEIDGKQM